MITDEGGWLLGQMQLWIFNLAKPPFNDSNVRQAVADAINEKRMNEAAYFGLARPAYSVLGKTVPFWNEEVTEKHDSGDKARDIEKANRLLDEAGYPKTQAEEAKIWADSQKIISEDLPVLSIVEMPYTGAVRAEWKDVFPGVDAYLRIGETVCWTKGELPRR